MSTLDPLRTYTESLRLLVEAIDAGVSAEMLESLSEQADSHCAAALAALAALAPRIHEW